MMGEQSQNESPAGKIQQRKGDAQEKAPSEKPSHGFPELYAVPCSDGLAHKGFGRIGKAIDEIGKEVKQLEKQGIYRQQGVSGFGRLQGEKRQGHDQADGADKDIRIDLEKFLHVRGDAHSKTRELVSEQFAVITVKENQGKQQTRVLRYDIGQRNTVGFHSGKLYE